MPHFIFVPEVYVIESSDNNSGIFPYPDMLWGLRDNIDEDMSVQRNFQLLQYPRPE